jgi:hypothetical protein
VSLVSSQSNRPVFLLHTGELIRRRATTAPEWDVLRPPGASSGELCAADQAGTLWCRSRDQTLRRFTGEHFEAWPTNCGLQGRVINCLIADPQGRMREIALREPEYGPLQILRFTTGAMLLYSGAMSLTLYRGIRAGRRSTIGVSAAAGFLFWLYLVFTFPLPGTGGNVPRELVLLTLYLFWLGAAAFASQPQDSSALPSVRPAAA